MQRTILITRPQFDPATHYLREWAKKIIFVAEDKGFNIYTLEPKECTKKEFEKRLLKNNPHLVLLNGHGSYDRVAGQNNEVILMVGDNEHLLAKKIIHAFSCSSANKLGPACISKGAIAYIGFDQDFIFWQDERYTATPLKDNVAKHFLEPTNLAPISLIKGNTVKEAFNKSQDAFDKAIKYFETHYTLQNSHILFALRYNKAVHKMHGKANATIFDL
ncbi:MAG: hypothetical protein GX950_01925 [Candidatus Diapherotrites archaeon]|jgi:hypothetical protein|uniref:Gingipain domain-containing protein n=1 Tax=Candidatus Iainarchaeum sp. TaxID=3101447 RepID=A0A7K4BZ94_9ARCH|nr:hypothetical protein [Candidatus Diapherotrites archaeon]